MVTSSQQQTADAFGYQWARRSAFDLETTREMARKWNLELYGDVCNAPWWKEYGPRPRVLDAGCGAGLTAIEMLGPILDRLDYTGVDLSDAYLVAGERFKERGLNGVFMKGDINDLPFPANSFDVILAAGVLHHTDSTRNALLAVAGKLKIGGRLLFYVYRKKGPIREFTDDYVREKLQGLPPEQAWDALYPLTKLGKALGELNIEIDVPEAIDVLDIPAGKINLQRLFYWHVCKAFYRPEYSLDEMNHINFDWFAPKNSHRQSMDEVLRWCSEASLVPERKVEEEAGITIIAKKIQGSEPPGPL
jgi:arsenite methyltransferase